MSSIYYMKLSKTSRACDFSDGIIKIHHLNLWLSDSLLDCGGEHLNSSHLYRPLLGNKLSVR